MKREKNGGKIERKGGRRGNESKVGGNKCCAHRTTHKSRESAPPTSSDSAQQLAPSGRVEGEPRSPAY